jgi:hypothetical protein
MFGFFITSIVLNTVSIFAALLTLYSRWWSLALSIFTFISALLTAAAAIIATVMFTIFKTVITSQSGVNIEASLGYQMFGFIWVAAGCSVAAFVIQLFLSCCCASRRDVKTGRRKGSKKAYGQNIGAEVKEKKGPRRRAFWKRRRAAQEGHAVTMADRVS